MSEHSNVMGGSTAAQRIHCPGSYQLEMNMPEPPESEFAQRGSMLHAAMELLLTADPQTSDEAVKLIGELEGQDMGYAGHEITEELISDKIVPAFQCWMRIVKEYDLTDWFIEQRVSLGEVIEGAFGTADVIAKDSDDRLHIIDWKFGDGVPVPAESNLGLGFYAAGAMYDTDEELQEVTEEISGVVLHIVQPRSGSSDDPLDTWETTEEWVEQLVDQAIQAIEKAMQPDAPVKAGKWCRWCDAKVICPAQQQIVGEVISKEPTLHGLDSVQFGDLLQKLMTIDRLKAEAFELAQHQLEQGVAIPGFKLVQKRATRKWIDPDEVEATCKKKRVKVDEMYNKTLKSPAQMEKSAKKVFTSALHSMVHSVSSGVTVVPDSDKRPAVSGSVELLANAINRIDKQEKAK